MRQRRAAALLVLAGTLLAALVLVADPASSAGGTLDTTYGTGGAARVDLSGGTGGFDDIDDLALQSDGKALAVGRTATGFAVIRLSTTGVLDTTFGSGGRVIGTSMSAARGIAVQSDGKVVVVGQSASTAGSMVLTRWSSTGVLDTTFGTGGSVTVAMTGANSGGQDLAIGSDGKINVLAVDAGVMVVLRYLSTGGPDTTYGTAGRATQTIAPSLTSRLAVQTDGKVLLTGIAGSAGGVVRLSPTGTADTTFGSGGTATTANHVPRAVSVLGSGKVVVAGDFGASDTKVMVSRRNPDGTLDTTFATTGVASFAVPGLARASARAMVAQGDGTVLVAGRLDNSTRASAVFVARLTSAGVLDPTFASGGIATFSTVNSLSTSTATALLIDGNGRYLIGGSIINDRTGITNDNDFLVLRVTGTTTSTSTSTTAPQATDAGGTVSTDPGAVPTTTNPLVVSVTTPVAGSVAIVKNAGTVPVGSRGLGGVTITAPTATVAAPLQLEFDVDVSTLPDSLPLRSIVVTRDSTVAVDCTSETAAAPDPCVASRTRNGDAASIVVLSTHASAWTLSRPIVQRIFGDDRILSSIAVSKESFGNGKASSAVLSRSDDFADALAAIPLAVAKKGPLLLTGKTTLDDRVLAEITRVLPIGKVVYVLGGPNALAPAIVERLTRWGYDVVRLGGDTRYDTAVVVATEGLGSPGVAIETTGLSFADALAAGAAAANVDGAVVLTAGPKQADATAAYVANVARRIAIGGPAAAADPDAEAIVGDDRYETAVLTAKVLFAGDVATIGVASGATFADALAGGVHAATMGGPLLLLPPKGALPVVVSIYLRDQKSPPSAYVYGGTSALGADIAAALQKALGG
jgi:uncharacterized delta-60 repeat protein